MRSASRSRFRPRDVAHAIVARVAPAGWFQVRGPSTAGAAAYLTFDDGPDPDHTPQVLEALARSGARATFFVIGERAARCPELIHQIAREGHTIGHHSFSHALPGAISAAQLADEIARTDALLGPVPGPARRLFRPPYGVLTPAKLLAVWRAGYRVILWNVDPKDFDRSTTPERVLTWFGTHPIGPRDIVLLHDTGPNAAAILPELIGRARRDRLSISPLS